jgi:hypothetical protein
MLRLNAMASPMCAMSNMTGSMGVSGSFFQPSPWPLKG